MCGAPLVGGDVAAAASSANPTRDSARPQQRGARAGRPSWALAPGRPGSAARPRAASFHRWRPWTCPWRRRASLLVRDLAGAIAWAAITEVGCARGPRQWKARGAASTPARTRALAYEWSRPAAGLSRAARALAMGESMSRALARALSSGCVAGHTLGITGAGSAA